VIISTFESMVNNKNFRYLLVGNFFGNCAVWLQFVSVGWLTYDLTGSGIQSMMTVAIRAIPTLLLSPVGGVWADKMSRNKLAAVSQSFTAITALVFAVALVLGLVDNVIYIYAYMIFTGLGFAVTQPVRQALIANTVKPDDLGNALALNAMTVTSMRLLGAVIAGTLIVYVDYQWNFFVETALYIGMTLLQIPMKTPFTDKRTSEVKSVYGDLVSGLGYIGRNTIVLRLMILNFLRTVVFTPILLLLPYYTSEALNSEADVGTLMIIMMGLAGVLSSLYISTFGYVIRKGFIGPLTLIGGGIVILTLGMSNSVWVSVPIMLLLGICQTHFIVSNQTLIQETVTDEYRGRVSSVWHYEQGLIPLSTLIIGLLAANPLWDIGISNSLIITGLFTIGLSSILLLWYKDIARLK